MFELNKIYCMDAEDGTSKLENSCIDLCFTSPPYFNAREYSYYESYDIYLDFIRRIMIQIHRILSDDGFFILNTSPVIVPRKSRNTESIRVPIPFDTFCLAKDVGFKYIDDIIWEKPDGASNRAVKFSHHRRPMAYKPFTITEYLFVFRKNAAPLIDRGIRKHSKAVIKSSLVEDGYERTNVWKISPSHNKDHPATFPEELANKIISYYSFIGDTVLDPFMGSGTTAKMAKLLGRNYIGFEVSQKYIDIAEKRCNQF